MIFHFFLTFGTLVISCTREQWWCSVDPIESLLTLAPPSEALLLVAGEGELQLVTVLTPTSCSCWVYDFTFY